MLRSSSITIPFSGGLQQKGDHRLQQPPALDKCVDAEFDDVGGLRTRKPYSALGVNVLGGGTLSNIRRIVDNGGELLCFTQTGLYSWDANNTAWVSKGTHMACAVDEQQVAVDTSDQYDADMALFGNAIFYAWYSAANAGVYLTVADSTTGALIVAPFKFATATIPRLVALSTRVLLVYYNSGGAAVTCAALDPATLTQSALAAATTVNLTSGSTPEGLYDIAAAPDGSSAGFAALLNPATSYLVGSVNAALTVTRSVKARRCDSAVAVAVTPDGTGMQTFRSTSTPGVKGDYLAYPALTDLHTDEAISTAQPSLISAAFSTVKVGGQYVCYAFYDTNRNTVDAAGTVGTEAIWKAYLSPASRAFDYNGTVYCWGCFSQSNGFTLGTTFGSGLQNAFYLVDGASNVIAKSAYNIAAAQVHRPSSVVAVTSGRYAFCGSINRQISVASTNSTAYAQRTGHRADVTFDDDRARRCLRLGRTLYVTGGEVKQYDGVQLAEVGFHVVPWYFFATFTGSGGNLSAGTYAFKSTFRWENAQGEIERSTTSCVGSGTAVLSDTLSIAQIDTTDLTHKGTAIAVEMWRTLKNPTAESPFYLSTSKDPSVTSNPNRYLPNTLTGASAAFTDTLSDATLATKENNPENGSVLENLAPPACTIITADASRLYLAGIAGAPNVVWYSKTRAEGEIAAFNDGLTIQLPAAGGDIAALAFLNETLIVFKKTAIYALPGEGFDNTGGGNNFGPARLLSTDVGATSAESVGITDMGLVFKSDRGWYLLDKGWQVQYIGAPVVDSDTETPLAVNVVTGQHQVRILTANRLLVWDTLVNQWGEWSIASGATACLWNGVHLYATISAVYQQRSDFVGVNYGMDVETAWIKPADPVGQCRIQWLMPLGEYRSTCALRIRIGRNYRQDGAGNWEYFDDKYRTPATVVGGPLQVRIGPSIPGMEAVKVRLTAVSAVNSTTPPTGEAIKLSALGIEFGVQPGLFKRLASAQKA